APVAVGFIEGFDEWGRHSCLARQECLAHTRQKPRVAIQPVEDEAIHPRIFRQRNADHFFIPTMIRRGESFVNGAPSKSPKTARMVRLQEENIIEISSRSYPRTRSR